MSNKTPNTSLQSTKQMLDELDALMEKMLTLPVNELDEAAIPPTPNAPEPKLSATVTLLERPRESETRPSPRPATPMPSYQAPELETPAPPVNPPHFQVPPANEPVAEFARPLARQSAPEPAEIAVPHYETPAPLTNDVMPVSVLPRLEPLLGEESGEPTRSYETQWLYWPLLWVNQGFDRTTGGLVRGEAGRFLLGLMGLALLAAGAVWFLKDYLGWNW